MFDGLGSHGGPRAVVQQMVSIARVVLTAVGCRLWSAPPSRREIAMASRRAATSGLGGGARRDKAASPSTR
jgi:hypothetical protein